MEMQNGKLFNFRHNVVEVKYKRVTGRHWDKLKCEHKFPLTKKSSSKCALQDIPVIYCIMNIPYAILKSV